MRTCMRTRVHTHLCLLPRGFVFLFSLTAVSVILLLSTIDCFVNVRKNLLTLQINHRNHIKRFRDFLVVHTGHEEEIEGCFDNRYYAPHDGDDILRRIPNEYLSKSTRTSTPYGYRWPWYPFSETERNKIHRNMVKFFCETVRDRFHRGHVC